MGQLINMGQTVTRMASGIYSVTRYINSGYVGGRYQIGTPTTFSIQAAIQIAQGRDLLILPEGLRNKEIIIIFCTLLLQTAQALPTANDADVVGYNGFLFEVITAEDRSGTGGYFRCLAKRQGK